jgi:hypothetical protein
LQQVQIFNNRGEGLIHSFAGPTLEEY